MYNVSFVEGKLHIFRKNFQLRTEIRHRFVLSKHTHVAIAYIFSAVLTTGIPSHRRRRDFSPNISLSYCFEELCTGSTVQEPHGTFFSIVSRKIGGLNIIMAGEIDCSTSMYFDLLASSSPLTSIPSRYGAQAGELP